VHGTGSIFVEGLDNASRLWERGQHKLSEAFCSEPHAFDFWYDDSGSLRYENHTCLQVCARSALNPRHRCLDSDELADHEGPQSVVLVTHVQESDSRLTTTRNYFVPSVDALSIRLLFTYRVPSLQWYQTTMATSYGTSHSSRYDVHTVAMDSSGKPWKTFAPGADPTLSLHDLLFLSGAVPLDRPQRLAGRNCSPDVSTEGAEAGPSGRISGMELTIRLQCGNMRLSDTGIELAYEENTCVLLAHAIETWVPIGIKMKQNKTLRRYNGVRIKLTVGGSFWTPDLNTIFINVASSIVMLQIPNSVVFFIAVWCCGHISFIYRRLIYKKFSIATEAGAMAMRLLEHEVAFNDLEDPSHGKIGEISRNAMSDGIGHIMERRGHFLDESALQHMVDFCLNTVTHDFRGADKTPESGLHMMVTDVLDGVNTIYWDVKEAFGMHPPENTEFHDTIDVDKFASACSSTEPINFDALVRLFDKDRKRSWLERFFMPMKLRECLAHEQPAQGPEEITREFSTDSKSMNRRRSLKRNVSTIRHHVNHLFDRATEHNDTLQEIAGRSFEQKRTLDDLVEKVEILSDCLRNLEQRTQANLLQKIETFSVSIGNLEKRLNDSLQIPLELHDRNSEPEKTVKSDAACFNVQSQLISSFAKLMESRMALIEKNIDIKLERHLASVSFLMSNSLREPTELGLLSQSVVDVQKPFSDAKDVEDYNVERYAKLEAEEPSLPKKDKGAQFAAPTTLYCLDKISSA